MPTKPKMTQPETPEVVQTRDFFETPKYATKLLIPFIPKSLKFIWEPAAGRGAISNYLIECGYSVKSTDINGNYEYYNFLDAIGKIQSKTGMIITNPPFSLKKKFYLKCMEIGIPWALLIPADYSSWLIESLRFNNTEKIIPTSRINYITPSGKQGKESASQFHSLWLTWGLNLGRTETFVDLTKQDKEFI